jgi:hypothetical protein
VLGQVDRAIALAPDNVSAYFAKSMYLNGSQRANEGLRAAAEGLAINPNYAPLYNARGYAEIGLGRMPVIAQATLTGSSRPPMRSTARRTTRRPLWRMALRFSPKLTVKSVARTNPLPVALEGLRKAGLPEE